MRVKVKELPVTELDESAFLHLRFEALLHSVSKRMLEWAHDAILSNNLPPRP